MSNKPAKRQPSTSTELEKSSAGVIPKITQKNDQWEQWAFSDWIQEQNQQSEDKFLKNILGTENTENLGKQLLLFTIEVRKKDGEHYTLPLSTSCCVPCSVSCDDATNMQPFDIFAKKDVCFRQMYGTMETVFQMLHIIKIAFGQR